MDSPEINGEDLNTGEYEDKVIFLDLDFLFNVFLREGANINMRVVKGIREGQKAIMAGISDGSLVVVFDTPVPDEVIFEDYSISSNKAELN